MNQLQGEFVIAVIERCRICKNPNLVSVLDLGAQSLTGVFPGPGESVLSGPIELVKCDGDDSTCGLVQLRHTYPPDQMYGDTYGYRSGLNASMVAHLKNHVERICSLVSLNTGDVVLDIGSNDGTTLGFFPTSSQRIGMDPAAKKFSKYYSDGVIAVSDFFTADKFLETTNAKSARVITSFAMMYDLNDPVAFANDVASILASDGVWVFEQSYMPHMVTRNAFDTVCHEHVEYYSLRQIKRIVELANLQIIDVEFNDSNGGSFAVVATHLKSTDFQQSPKVAKLLDEEDAKGFNTLSFIAGFSKQVTDWKKIFQDEIGTFLESGRSLGGLGASTKGNVLLQFAGLSSRDILAIGDVNQDKWGCVTPGTNIPIVSEDEILGQALDAYLVLPWHFKNFFVSNPKFVGRQLLFPLPIVEMISL